MNQQDLEIRIQRLENRLNRYRSLTLVLGLALAGLAGIAANAPQQVSPEIRAHKFVVVDDKGKEVMHLQSGPHGGVLNLLNTDGFPVVRAGASDKGGKLALGDVKGEQYLEMSAAEDTGGEMTVTDKKGTKSMFKPAGGPQAK